MPRLSVVMIVKNEAHCLGDCLESVRDIADEVAIGDTGSTDGTQDLAAAHGARVFDVPWRDDFAAARNEALRAATGEWLLHMDADEVVDPDGARRMREIVEADGHGADAVEVTLANYCDAIRSWRWVPVAPGAPSARGHAGYMPAPLLRLFRNGRGYEYREAVHENITESVVERGGRLLREPRILIHHYGYAADGTRSEEKRRFYLRIARRKVEQRPGDPKSWLDLAEQAFAAGEPGEAERASREALRLDPGYMGAAMTLANIHLNRGSYEEARQTLTSFENAEDVPPQLLVALGAIATRQGRLEEALRYLHKAVRLSPRAPMARLYLARAMDLAGQNDGALEHLRAARMATPDIREVRDRLAAHEVRTRAENACLAGRPSEALRLFTEAMRLDALDPVMENGLGVCLHAMGLADEAVKAFERALRLAPAMSDAQANLTDLMK